MCGWLVAQPLAPLKKALFHRALIHSELNDFEWAIKDYSSLLEVDPEHKLAHANRGVIFINLNRIEEGCADLKKAKALGDKSPAILELIPKHCQ